jgi:class 3 adenylate cyclase
VWGFTPLTLAGTPEHAIRTLNANFEIILPEITSRGGMVDKFVGDAVMAVFRGDDHPTRALDACVSARAALADLAARTGEGSPYAQGISAGVDTGTVIAGSTGSKVVSRHDYTVLGEVVNSAARLQMIASRGQILVGESVFALAHERFELDPMGNRTLSGKPNEIAVWNVLAKLEPESPVSMAATVVMDDADERAGSTDATDRSVAV